MNERILLSHGSGGLENHHLIQEMFVDAFSNQALCSMDDAAVLHIGEMAVSTDSFTVSPLFFPGGDIGKLAIAGTANDVAMRGAQPQYLSAAFILEEGLELDTLRRVVASMSAELAICGASIVTGDTKVVPKGVVDRMIINTTGFGRLIKDCSVTQIKPEDHIIVSGPIAQHGSCIYAEREEIAISGLISDCCTLWPAVNPLLHADLRIHAMRDATRGGLSAVLNEWALQTGHNFMVQERDIPLTQQVEGFAELLGIDPYILACEGVFVLAVDPGDSSRVIEILHQEGHKHAALIGTVNERARTDKAPKVVLHSAYNTQRLMEFPSGEILPRIC
jgi:hydrogenase expression/formation protein HypE